MNTTLAECQIQGNQDLYGLGIRLGFYMQWASTLLVTLFSPADEPTFTATNLLLHVALLAGVVRATAYAEVSPAEVLITLGMLFGALSSLTGDGLGLAGGHGKYGACRAAVYIATAAWSSWFWFVGRAALEVSVGNDGEPQQGEGGGEGREEECGLGPLMSATRNGGWVEVLGKIVSVGGVVVGLGLLVLSVNQYGRERNKAKKNAGTLGNAATAHPASQTFPSSSTALDMKSSGGGNQPTSGSVPSNGRNSESIDNADDSGNTTITATASNNHGTVATSTAPAHGGSGNDSGGSGSERDRLQTEISFLVISLAVIACSVAWIEYLLRENRIVGVGGVDAVGQLLPLLVAFLGLLSTVLKVLRKRMWMEERCWMLLGRHLT